MSRNRRGREKSAVTDVREPGVASLSGWFEQHDRDDPLARPLLVHLVAVVVVVDQPPQFLALGALGLPRVNRDAPTADLDRDRIGMSAQVVIPGGMVVRACLGGDDHVPAAVPGVQQRHAARLAGPGPARVQEQHRLAHRYRQPPAGQRDQAPVDDREYVHEQPAAEPGPRERLRQFD